MPGICGPEKGWLIIHGGGTISEQIQKHFVSLAGGRNSNVVFIPTAMADEDIEKGGFFKGHGKGLLSRWGINPDHVTMLHARAKAHANSQYFIQALRNASGVVIWGGRQWRLADSYLNTGTEREIKALVARGGVVFGSSAGATIQGSLLVRGAPGTPGNPEGDNKIMMSPGHETGFGLIPNSAIDQHLSRGRERDLVPVIEKHPELVGIGIDEGAAILVHGDHFSVVSGRVGVYHHDSQNCIVSYFLSPSQVFDLKKRIVVNKNEPGS